MDISGTSGLFNGYMAIHGCFWRNRQSPAPYHQSVPKGVSGSFYDRTNAQQHKRRGSVGNKSVPHTPRQDDTLVQVHYAEFAAGTIKSCAALHDHKHVYVIGERMQLVFAPAAVGFEHHIEFATCSHDLVNETLFG